jgi:acetate kinase
VKILVINTGSSSIKYKLFDVERGRCLASGLAERIGEEEGSLTHRVFPARGSVKETREKGRIAGHREGLERVVSLMDDPDRGAVESRAEISAIGHRVVHGGESFRDPALIDDGVVAAIRENARLAPLHNPPNLTGIEIARALFPDAPQVAVFDTAFHQTMPPEAFLYAIPSELYEEERIRRYGFHGTSHAYVAGRAAEFIGRSPADLNLITIHLGNGASMAAIRQGRCVDTTMGLTPLAGLVMGTRSGDVDPALPFFLADRLGMSVGEIDILLNRESGLRGMSGTNDMREVLAMRGGGDARAEIAVKVYTYRVKKYIGAFLAVLGRLDALIFTAGIGENSPAIRDLCCRGLEEFGIVVDGERNRTAGTDPRDIASPAGKVRVLVIPTDEELQIAEETKRVVGRARENKGRSMKEGGR